MFRVGQKVVCVNAVPDAGKILGIVSGSLTEGEVYTILDFVQSHYGPGEICVRLQEIVRVQNNRRGFRASRFRPVEERKTDISIFTAILAPKKQGVEA